MPLRNDPAAAARGSSENFVSDVVNQIKAAPEEMRESLAQDAFLQDGYRRLASNMISLAIRDLLRAPKVAPPGKNKAHRDGIEARQWLNGEGGSQLSYEACCAALGMEDWAEGLKNFIFENPQSAEELFRGYERCYYVHLSPDMNPGLPTSAGDNIDGDVDQDLDDDPDAPLARHAAGIESDPDDVMDWSVGHSMKAH
jgi:hypothetical protein